MTAPRAVRWHPLAICSLGVWLQLLRRHGGGIPPGYWPRTAGLMAASLLTSPLRVAERLTYGRRIAHTRVEPPPVFIQGFHRSGTTHLANLLAHDPRLGHPTTYQGLTSPFFLCARGWLKRRLAERIPSSRPGDNVTVRLDSPQDPELALCSLSVHSLFHQMLFPERARQIMEKVAGMRLSDNELRVWRRKYLEVARKATLACDNRRLVIKSPVNLGRTPHLLDLFPDAKFIHIVRDPYVIYRSVMKMYRESQQVLLSLQPPADEARSESVLLDYYAITMRAWLRDRETIPDGHLAELRFEDLESDPLGALERVYAELSLPGWSEARSNVAQYLDTLSGYTKNVYRFDREVIEKVEDHWGFAVREWGYGQPEADS